MAGKPLLDLLMTFADGLYIETSADHGEIELVLPEPVFRRFEAELADGHALHSGRIGEWVRLNHPSGALVLRRARS